MTVRSSILLFAALLAAVGCAKRETESGTCEAIGKKVAADAEAKMPKGDLPPEAMKQMKEMTIKMVGLIVTSCKEDNWSQAAIACGLRARDPEAECDDKLTDDQKKKMQRRMEKAIDEMSFGSPPPPAVAEAPAESAGLPACDAYVAATAKFMACEHAPQSARDAAEQSLSSMKASWASIGQLPDGAKKAVADACTMGLEALKQGAQAMGCPL